MAKGLTKKAKMLSENQIKATLGILSRGKRAKRDTAAFLLSVRAGLRAKEVAEVTWSMVTDSEGKLTRELRITNTVAKGDNGGRCVDLAKDLKAALVALHADLSPVSGSQPIIGGTAVAMRVWFHRLYEGMGFDGCSSHSGRRTAITKWARNITTAGGSMRDVQDMAGHADLATTQGYIEVNKHAKSKVVDM
jgi:integrase/recombinase XerD